MKKALAMEWVKALRSGKYKKGTGHLKNKNEVTGEKTFCCLGVLCDIMGSKGTKAENGNYYFPKSDASDSYNDNTGLMPIRLFKKAGMKKNDGELKSLSTQLTSLNDSGFWIVEKGVYETLNFDEIADLIQINYKEL